VVLADTSHNSAQERISAWFLACIFHSGIKIAATEKFG